MTQSTILAAGNTDATSTVVVVGAGEKVTIGIFSAAGGALPASVHFRVYVSTPGAAAVEQIRNQRKKTLVVDGLASVTVRRPPYTGTAYGVFKDIP